MATKTYDPKKVLITFANIPLNSGIAPDTFLKVEADEDTFEKQVGADGDVTRTLNQNRGAKASLTLMAKSQVNDALSAIYNADLLLGNGVAAFMAKEANGTTLLLGSESWIKRLPSTERAKAAGTVEWEFDIAALEGTVGGLL
jgi:hypothetical protein